ncbi:MAG: hypothetical protein HFI57_09780 [Lachnospiraceae bacterium]|nr:hypothetical protein [Lachnospiraceae bacterium]
MKNKSKFYTGVLVLLAFAVVFGGWFLTVKLLKQREEKFLAGTGAVSMKASEMSLFADNKKGSVTEKNIITTVEGGDAGNADTAAGILAVIEDPETETEFHGISMSESVRARILIVWEEAETRVIHEPEEDQMNMEQAIVTGQDWIKSMAGYGKIPDRLKDYVFEETYASFYTPQSKGVLYPEFDKSLFSYWNVQFEGEGISVGMKIHAASGEVWYADFSVEDNLVEYSMVSYPGASDSAAESPEAGTSGEVVGLVQSDAPGELLERAFPFMVKDGVGKESVTDLRENTVYQMFPEGSVYAAVRRYNLYAKGNENVTVTVFWIGSREKM